MKIDNLVHFLSRIPEPFYSWIRALANELILLKSPEKVCKYGEENQDKTFYLIDNITMGGFAGQYDAVLGHIIRARKKGYIPYVDLSNPQLNIFSDGVADDIHNYWEDYFCQATDISIDEIYRSKNVIHNSNISTIYTRINKNNISKRYIASQTVKFNSNTLICIEKKKAEIGWKDGNKYLGAYYRGTDYRKSEGYNPVGHAIVPTIQVFCDCVKKFLVEFGEYDGLFFMTEEQESLEYFCEKFDDVMYVHKERVTNYVAGQTLCNISFPNTSRYENNLLYVVDMALLSECSGIIGTWNGGIRTAMNWNNNKYERVNILDFGSVK